MRGRGLLGSMIGGALAAISMGMLKGLDFRGEQSQAQGFKAPFAKKSGGRQRSASKGAAERLVLDRSNNVRKIQRWLNNGTMHVREPSQKAVMRHRERRVEAQRAANLAKLAAE